MFKKIAIATVLLTASVATPVLAQSSEQGRPNVTTAGDMGLSNFTAADTGYFRTYAMRQNRPSMVVDGDLSVGRQLPGTVQYGAFDDPRYQQYRYTRVNERYLVVDSMGRVVHVIN